MCYTRFLTSDIHCTLVLYQENSVWHCCQLIQQAADTQDRLSNWHQDTAKRLNIRPEDGKRKRDGFDGVIHFIPGLFNDDLNLRSIEKSTARMITTQASGHEAHHQDTIDLYAEDVQLIAKDGKVYYLPESKAK